MEQERNEFEALRSLAHHQVRIDTLKRIQENPTPTQEELRMGLFREMLEPQVRDAVFSLNRMGYYTRMSGFWGGGHPGLQRIDGRFGINRIDRKKLATLGVRICSQIRPGVFSQKKSLITYIEFDPTTPDLDVMQKQWNEIISSLTIRKRSARTDSSLSASIFRYQFGGQDFDIPFLERFIAALAIENTPERMQKYHLLLDAIRRGDRNLLPLGYPIS